MANEKYLMTMGMEKWRKCTSQIFDFWKFIAHEFAKLVERFSKIMNLWRIWKLPILLALFWPYMVEYDRQKLYYDNQHGKLKKICILDFFIWQTMSQRFVLNILRDFWKHQIMKNTKIGIFIGHFSNRYSKIWKINNISWR